MSWCVMPLLIKVEMTKENYIALIKESLGKYKKTYLKNNYKYDGTYFTLETTDEDDDNIYEQSARITKYVNPERQRVGLIFSKGWAYTTKDLYFDNAKCELIESETPPAVHYMQEESNYGKKRNMFLSTFPEREDVKFSDNEIDELFKTEIEFQKQYCLKIQEEVVYEIVRTFGYDPTSLYTDDDVEDVFVTLQEGNDLCVKEILTQYFKRNVLHVVYRRDQRVFVIFDKKKEVPNE